MQFCWQHAGSNGNIGSMRIVVRVHTLPAGLQIQSSVDARGIRQTGSLVFVL